MVSIKDELVSHEDRKGVFRLGHLYASALAGFLAGLIVGSVFTLLVVLVTSRTLAL